MAVWIQYTEQIIKKQRRPRAGTSHPVSVPQNVRRPSDRKEETQTMPRYDYRCTSCGNTFEVSHGMREHPQVVCPDCGGEAQRIFDVSGIVLKGSGFYNTDQRRKHTGSVGGKCSNCGGGDCSSC